MSEHPDAFKKRFPNLKTPTFQKKCGDTLLTICFIPEKTAGGLVIRGHDPLSDRFYDTAPVLPEDWRSFGFGKFSSLKVSSSGSQFIESPVPSP
jgi:hypothetical protein